MRYHTLSSALAAVTVLLGASLHQDVTPATASEQAETSTIPEELEGFSGLLVGKLVRKDDEKGELLMQVQQVKRVWRNSKAENPRAAEGEVFVIDSIAGQFLDVLLVLKPGDTFEIEARHVRGDRLNFLGEGFRKVPPITTDSPDEESEFPEGLQGFSGMLVGKLISKDIEQGTLTIQVTRVKRVWRNNKANRPYSAVGRTFVVEGVFGKFLDALLVIEPGQFVELEAKHVRGERLNFPGEWLRPASAEEAQPTESLEGARGFNGQVRGVVADKAENLIGFRVARVTRVWPRANRAENPGVLVGRTIKLHGNSDLHNRFLNLLKEGQELTLDIRNGEGERFVITELTKEQRELAARP